MENKDDLFHMDYKGYEIVCTEIMRGGHNSFVAWPVGDPDNIIARSTTLNSMMSIIDILEDSDRSAGV